MVQRFLFLLVTNVAIFACSGVVFTGCGGTEVNDKAARQSDRFYEAAYISWADQGDNLGAIRNLTRAVEANPNNDQAHYLLGVIRLGRGEYKEAKTHLLKAADLRAEGNPSGLAEAQNSLGVLYIHLKEYDRAIEILDRAVKEVLNREPWLALGNMGWAYIELGRYDDAIDKLKRALFEQPKFCVGTYRLGQAYYLKQDYATAEEALKKAIATPESGCADIQDAHYLLGMTYLRVGKDAESKAAFAKCRDISATSQTGKSCSDTLGGP